MVVHLIVLPFDQNHLDLDITSRDMLKPNYYDI